MLPEARAQRKERGGRGVDAVTPAHITLAIFLMAGIAGAIATPARAGHEVTYYPSFYPQEIRIDLLDPETAAKQLSENTLHAYLGAAPRFAGKGPDYVKSVVSLNSFLVLDFNPKSRFGQDRDGRCRAAMAVARGLTPHSDIVLQPYPITPYHADYLHHVDRVAIAKAATPADTAASANVKVRAEGTIGRALAPTGSPAAGDWEASLAEIPVSDLLKAAGVRFELWPAAPWAKEGWFHAYHALAPTMGDATLRKNADEAFARLTRGDAGALGTRVNLERDLVAALTRGCERVVLGYTLRREAYNSEFSAGVENIAFDSQLGMNAPVFVRTVKLKDFPWNGWLRVGMEGKPTAAWNPLAGFDDALGRLMWSVVADPAFVAIPYNSQWTPSRMDITPPDPRRTQQTARIPPETLAPEAKTGALKPLGSGKSATAVVRYRVLASSFHDDSEMTTADFLYPYALAFRWGTRAGEADAAFDPEIAAATAHVRDRFLGARTIRVDKETRQQADLVFTYHLPVVEVYLGGPPLDDRWATAIAPPWSAMPWHVLALMEAAVERKLAAFSKSEAERRGVPWLDLVRDPDQRSKLLALVKEFAQSGFRPAALADLVTTEDARARWQALLKFVEATGHFLVTNGPYRLAKWSPESVVFDAVRDFTYPVGLGTFNEYANPPRAAITGVKLDDGHRLSVTVDVEMLRKQQRDYVPVRLPFTSATLRDAYRIRPEARYLIVKGDGAAAAAGTLRWQPDGRFAATIPKTLDPGDYTIFVGVFLDSNTVDPHVGQIGFTAKGS
jgi:hypothetical protein